MQIQVPVEFAVYSMSSHRINYLGQSFGDSLENFGVPKLSLGQKTHLIIHETKNWDRIEIGMIHYLTLFRAGCAIVDFTHN
jgi:hypothetical protein